MQLRPFEVGTKNGQPAITWWRHGVAAAGEARIHTEVHVYPSEQARDAALFEDA